MNRKLIKSPTGTLKLFVTEITNAAFFHEKVPVAWLGNQRHWGKNKQGPK